MLIWAIFAVYSFTVREATQQIISWYTSREIGIQELFKLYYCTPGNENGTAGCRKNGIMRARKITVFPLAASRDATQLHISQAQLKVSRSG